MSDLLEPHVSQDPESIEYTLILPERDAMQLVRGEVSVPVITAIIHGMKAMHEPVGKLKPQSVVFCSQSSEPVVEKKRKQVA